MWDITKRRGWRGYGMAIVLVIIAVGVRFVFLPNLDNRTPYVTIFPAVALAAVYGGLYPGILATVLSGLLADYLWIDPIGKFEIDIFADRLGILVYIISCTTLAIVCEAMQQAQLQLSIATDESMQKSQLLDFAGDYIMIRDMDSKVIFWNRGAEKGYGFSAPEAVGKITHELLKTKFPESATVIMEELLVNGQWQGELSHLRKDRVRIVVESHQTIHYNQAGNPVSIMEINHDITERKLATQMLLDANDRLKSFNTELERQVSERTRNMQDINTALEEEIMERQVAQDALYASERQLRRFSDELIENNKELTSFANSIAHDFRSPMVNLKGFSRELSVALSRLQQYLHDEAVQVPEELQAKIEDVLNKDVPESLNFIYFSVDRLDRMVNALLGLARVGRQEMVVQAVDMNLIVSQTVHSFRYQLETNQIKVTVGPMPIVKTNSVAMEQIMTNLVDNAIKYLMPDRPGDIAILCKEEEERFILSVEDNGRGIAENDNEKIFQIFRRAGQQDIPGEGMGLAYVRTLVRQLSGKVWCESELGIGTKMSFSIPKRPDSGNDDN